MKRWWYLIPFLVVAPIAFGHYFLIRPITNSVSTTSPAVLGAPSTSTLWASLT